MVIPEGGEAALARLFTRQAVETLTEILRNRDLPQYLRDEAARSLIDHGLMEPAVSPGDPAKMQ
jgi:hypothetical protein